MIQWYLRFLLASLLSIGTFAGAQNLFFVPPTFPGTSTTVVGDINGDGKPDIVDADGTVLLGNGDGTFTTGKTITACPCNNPASLFLADFNGDGKLDLVTLTYGATNSFSVLLGNGDGTFQAPLVTATPAPVVVTAVGDLNGDGKPDVLVSTLQTSILYAYLGKGDGTFSSGINNGVSGGLILGDFNGDGKLDLAGFPFVQLGNGDGTFQPPLVFTDNGTFAAPVLAAGDFNSDGKLDLAISSSASPAVGAPALTQILLGNGDGTFQLPISITGIGGPIVAADVNQDGKLDLVLQPSSSSLLQQSNFVLALLGNGDGTLTPGTPYNLITDFFLYQHGTSLNVADFNSDGKLDIAAQNTLLLGNGDGTFRGNPGVLGISGSAVVGDFDHDGHPDFAAMIGPVNDSNLTDTVGIYLNDGTGKLTLSHTYGVPVADNYGSGDTVAAAVDLNGDGNLDLIFHPDSKYSWSLIVMLGNGDGTFRPPMTFAGIGGGFVTGMALRDLNGDGKPDAIVIAGSNAGSQGSMFVFLGNGDGTFGAPVQYFAGQGDGNVVSADFNADGKMDVAVGTSNGIELLLGNGDGTFQPATQISTSLGSNYARWLVTGDLNGDGKPDLIVSGTTAFEVLLGKGDGTFNGLTPVDDLTNGPLPLADLNGDGKLDILGAAGRQDLQLGFYLGNGDGTFGAFQQVVPNSGTPYIADFNSDGKLDIAVIQPGGLFYLFNTGAQVVLDFQVSASALSPSSVTPGSSASSTITFTPVAGFNGTLTLTCSGAPATVSCTVSPGTITLDGSTTATANVKVTTQAATAGMQMPSDGTPGTRSWPLLAAWLSAAGLLGISISVVSASGGQRRRVLLPLSAIGLIVGALLVLPSCGGGSGGSSGGGGGTPPGTYTLTVTAAASTGSGATSHSTTLSLVVQ